MNTIMKVVVFSFPLFALVLFIYLAVHREFRADFTAENVRFEQEWKEFHNLDPEKDPFFREQMEEALAARRKARQADEKLSVTEEELDRALRELDKETKNGPGEIPRPDLK